MKINISATISPEDLIEAGEKAGLSEDAVNYLRHFEEIPLELYVDGENGAVCGLNVLIDFESIVMPNINTKADIDDVVDFLKAKVDKCKRTSGKNGVTKNLYNMLAGSASAYMETLRFIQEGVTSADERLVLYQCPYERACKCSQLEPCNGCETWAEAKSIPFIDK